MSRNLCQIDCAACPGSHEHIVIEGPVREVTEKEDPGYYREHRGLLIAEARCVLCHALYFAWVDWPNQPHSHWHLKSKHGQRFCDLSYRNAFNDEPAPEDTPLFHVEVAPVRRLAAVDDHPYRTGNASWYAEGRARWQARADAAKASALSVADEVASLTRSEPR